MPTAAIPPDYPANALAPGTRVAEFEILGVLGIGGFGIVYHALDHALEREVAVKEYMPTALAGRTASLQVSLRSAADAGTFAIGLRSFVNEARLLARFDHPSLLKVYRFWEANGTAYMAMPVYRGRTLKATRQALQGSCDEAWLRALLTPLLDAIQVLHAEGVYHRDIAPDNILIEPDGRPVLLDFGAARRVIGDRSQTLTAIVKPAYAPIEQYAEISAARQGPWTDLYALGATLHFVLTGRPPPPATARALHDELQPLAQRGLPGCSAALCRAVDWMLAMQPGDRPPSVDALRAVLDGAALPPRGAAAPGAEPAPALDLTLPDGRAAPAAQVQPPALDAATQGQPPRRAASAASSAAAASAAAATGWAGDRAARRVLPLLALLALLGAVLVWWWAPGQWRAPASPQAEPPGAGVATAPGVTDAADAADAADATDAAAAQGATAATAVPGGAAGDRSPAPRSGAAGVLPATRAKPAGELPPPARVTPPQRTAPNAAHADATRPAAPAAVAADGGPAAAEVLAPAPGTLPAPIVSRSAQPAQAVLADDPEALCGKRVLLALMWCMERECAQAGNQNHPACRKWFAANRQRSPP